MTSQCPPEPRPPPLPHLPIQVHSMRSRSQLNKIPLSRCEKMWLNSRNLKRKRRREWPSSSVKLPRTSKRPNELQPMKNEKHRRRSGRPRCSDKHRWQKHSGLRRNRIGRNSCCWQKRLENKRSKHACAHKSKKWQSVPLKTQRRHRRPVRHRLLLPEALFQDHSRLCGSDPPKLVS